MTEEIKFYSTRAQWGEFSNFARFPIKLDGQVWPTSEHYFQAMKFKGTKRASDIRKAKGPKKAADMGRDRSHPTKIRRDWERVKEDVMHRAVKAKFTQHRKLEELLLSTGTARLVEHTEKDSYWGDGGNGSGKNRLGHILERVREEIRGSR